MYTFPRTLFHFSILISHGRRRRYTGGTRDKISMTIQRGNIASISEPGHLYPPSKLLLLLLLLLCAFIRTV